MRDAQAKTVYLKDYQAPDFFIDETRLDFSLFEDHALVVSHLKIRRNTRKTGVGANSNNAEPLVLDGVELELLQLKIDGHVLAAADYVVNDEQLTIAAVPDVFELNCTTKIYPHKNTALEGLYKSKTMFCTQCEAQGFRKITYYLDRPDVMSVFTTSIEADKTLYPVLLSNGDQTQMSELEDGRVRVTWHDPFKKPCYLFALVAGELQCVSDSFTTMSGRDVDLKIFVEEKDIDKCDHAMRSLKAAMRWDEEVYGREYDLNVFMIVAVDDFNMGAMENKGLNIFNTSCVLANPATTTDASYQRVEGVVAHEYFHNWSGNRVTCRDWFQLSLKEGFTVFRDSAFSADMNSSGVKRIEDVNFLRSYQFPEDASPMAHPIQPASFIEISNFYTMTVYEKGAEVVRMLAHLLGAKKFRQATDLYFERFDGQAVTCDDFVDVMEEVLGADLSQFRYWYSQAGTPLVEASGQYDADAKRYVLQLKQSCRQTPETPVGEKKQDFVIPVSVGLVTEQGDIASSLAGNRDTQHVLVLDQEQQRFVFDEVESPAVISLLRGFSAPVKLAVDYSDDDLLFLLKHDSDPYAKWDAGQQFYTRVIQRVVNTIQTGQEPQMDKHLIDGMQSLLTSSCGGDKALLAEMLRLPNEAYLSEHYEVVDVHAIHQAREFIVKQLANALDWMGVYQENISTEVYQPSADQIAQRGLKNLALSYLLASDHDEGVALCFNQYQQADNMTDASAALKNLVHASHSSAQALAKEALDDFYQTWKHESLVVNLWLQIQASNPWPDTLSTVQALMQHEAFDANNPNKLRSLIAVFARSNLINFHQKNGAGYEFLTDQILWLDKRNPQMASSLVVPLIQWQRHQQPHDQMMHQALQRIAAGSKSKDVQEVVIKSLK